MQILFFLNPEGFWGQTLLKTKTVDLYFSVLVCVSFPSGQVKVKGFGFKEL